MDRSELRQYWPVSSKAIHEIFFLFIIDLTDNLLNKSFRECFSGNYCSCIFFLGLKFVCLWGKSPFFLGLFAKAYSYNIHVRHFVYNQRTGEGE